MPGNVIAVAKHRASCPLCGSQMYIWATSQQQGVDQLWLHCLGKNCQGHLSLPVSKPEFGRIHAIMDANFPA